MNLYEAFIDEMQKTAEEKKKKPSVLKHTLAGALGGTALGALAAFGPRRAWRNLRTTSKRAVRQENAYSRGKIDLHEVAKRKEINESINMGVKGLKGLTVGAGTVAGGSVGALAGLTRRAYPKDDKE